MSDRLDAPLSKAPGLAAAVKRAFTKAFVFSGRASRAEFWLFALFYLVGLATLILVWSMIFGPNEITVEVPGADGGAAGSYTRRTYSPGWLGDIFSLVCLIPGLSLTWRRLHDRNLAGWWALIPPVALLLGVLLLLTWAYGFEAVWDALTGSGALYVQAEGFLPALLVLAPLVLALYLLIQLLRAGTPGTNRFGPPVYAEGAR